MYRETSGHFVTLVSDGAQAVQALQHECFDLILMDIQMPVLDGMMATRLIRALPIPDCDIPINALTASALAGDRERYLAEGMNDCVAKPVEGAALLWALKRATEGAEAESATVSRSSLQAAADPCLI
jgi:CheY-like chemotaxis protein